MSGERHKKIIEGLKNLHRKPNGMHTILEAKVKSVDDDNLAQCEADGLDIPDVQLRPISDGSNKSVIIVPKVGSYVLIGSIEGRQDYIVLSVDQAEKVMMKVGDITLDVLDSSIKLNGDGKGGILIEDKLVAELKKVNNILTALKQICSSPVNEPGNGAPSAFQAALNVAISTLSVPTYTNITNDKVKHG